MPRNVQAEVLSGGAWHPIEAAEAVKQSHQPMRCTACQQKVVPFGAFRPIDKPRFVHRRLTGVCAA